MTSSSIQKRIGLLAASALLAIGCSSPSGSVQTLGSIQTLGFGTGGIGCEITGPARTFAVGQVVHMAADFGVPPKHVDIVTTRDGALEHSEGVDLGETEDCVFANLNDLPAGHYVFTLTPVPALETPPLSGGFEVTP